MATSRASSFNSVPPSPPTGEPPPGERPAGNGHLQPLQRRRRSKADEASPVMLMLCAVTFILLCCFYLYAATQGKGTEIGLLLVPLFTIALAPWLARVARAQTTFQLLPIMILGLLLRYLATYFRLQNAADAIYYHRYGLLIAPSFRALNFGVDVKGEVPGTGSVRYISGLVTVLTGSSMFAEFLVFTTFGFIGIVFFYKAFVTAMPNADHRRYALLIFLWPSMLYWPSSVGKEAIMTFGAGIASYGGARLFRRQLVGIPMVVFGVWLAFMIRPHIGLTLVIGIGLALVFARGRGDSASVTAGKLMAALALIVVGGVLMGRTASFLGVDSLNSSGIESALNSTTDSTSQGGSEFSPVKADNPVRFPAAIGTVLLRPFPNEAHNVESFGTSLEGFVLLLLIASSWRRLKKLPRALLNEPYVMYAMAATLMFCFIFSYVANFGLLARQRTQIFPFLFVLVSFIPDPRPKGSRRKATATRDDRVARPGRTSRADLHRAGPGGQRRLTAGWLAASLRHRQPGPGRRRAIARRPRTSSGR